MSNRSNKAKKIFFDYLPAVAGAGIIKTVPALYSYFGYKPTFAVLNITDACCFRCIMCSQWRHKAGDELSTAQWLDVLAQLKKSGVKEVVFSGGEPFLRNDIMDIISYASRIGLATGVITNGYLLNRELIDRAVRGGLKSFSISVDAVGEEFDQIRGLKGAYDKVIHSCRLLSEYKNSGIDIYICLTLMKKTLVSYKEVLALANEFGFLFAVNLFDYTPYFFKDAKITKEQFWPDNNGDFYALSGLQKDIVDIRKKNPRAVYHTYSEIRYFGDYFKDPLQKDIPCIVSQQRIGIDSSGNVFGGCWSMGSFGNIIERPLKDIIDLVKYRTAHRNMFFKNCPGCSCGYAKNLRYNLANLFEEALFRVLPFTRRAIWRQTGELEK